MTCPTCSGLGSIHKGNAYEDCPDCEGGEIKNMTMKLKSTDLAFIIFCLLGSFLWPCEAKGQSEDDAIISSILSNKQFAINNNTIVAPKTKVDTITVRVLCESEARPKCLDCLPDCFITNKRMERTLELQTVPCNSVTNQNGYWHSDLVYRTETKWIVTETRYLDPIEGCYQLTPLTND